MQILFIAQFDITPAQTGTNETPVEDAYHALVRHASTWLGGLRGEGPTAEDLSTTGDADLTTEVAGVPAPFVPHVKWEVQGVNEIRALRLAVSQPLAATTAQFVTQVTISTDGAMATMRVAMGREITSGWLSPARVEVLHRPWIVSSVVRDTSLDVRVLGQRVDGRFDKIREAASVQALSDAIQNKTRLPIVVLHPRSDTAWDVTRKVSNGLLGLASVVTLNYTTARALADLHPDLAVPDGGARLIWPDLGAGHPRYARVEVEKRGAEGMRALWMELLADLSVVARGSDVGWERARRAAQRATAQAATLRLEEARAGGDLQLEVEASAVRIRELTEDVQFWELQSQELTTDLEEIRTRAEEYDNARRERDYWKQKYYGEQGAQVLEDADPWAATPMLLPSEASATYRHLEATADDRIAFTSAAEPPGMDLTTRTRRR